MYGAAELPMTVPYSWFSITITKTWVKAGIAEADAVGVGVGVGVAVGVGVGVGVAVGVGVGVGVAVGVGVVVGVGMGVGDGVGFAVGEGLGIVVGVGLGPMVGTGVGETVGKGVADGLWFGAGLGATVGEVDPGVGALLRDGGALTVPFGVADDPFGDARAWSGWAPGAIIDGGSSHKTEAPSSSAPRAAQRIGRRSAGIESPPAYQ